MDKTNLTVMAPEEEIEVLHLGPCRPQIKKKILICQCVQFKIKLLLNYLIIDEYKNEICII